MFVRCRLTDQTGGILCLVFRQVNLTAQIKRNPTQTDRVRTCVSAHKKHERTHKHITLQQSAKTSVPQYVCVCARWQRQTVMLLPAAQPPEGKRQTLHPIYRNTARYRKTLRTTTPLLALARSCNWVYECVFVYDCMQN